MRDHRPVNLDLSTIHFPITAIVSILHRISGVVIAIATPFLLYILYLSLQSPHHYNWVLELLTLPLVKVLFWLVLTAIGYHCIAGIRHLLMDLGIGESLLGGRVGAWIVIVCATLCSVVIFLWLGVFNG